MTAAQITPEEWRNHLELEGRILGENHRLAKAMATNTNETARVAQVCSKLDATVADLVVELRQLKRRQRGVEDSFTDLERAQMEAQLRAALQANKRLRSLPAKVLKWGGWGLTTLFGLLKLYDYAIQHGWLH